MANLFMDSFAGYATGDITRKWTAVQGGPTVQSSVTVNGPNALQCADNDQVHLALPATTSWVFGFKFQIDGFALSHLILQIRDDPAGTQVSLRINTDATLEVLRITSTSVTDGKSILTLSADTWYHIEMKLTIADSIAEDSCKVKVNGADWITVATGQDLQNTVNTTANLIKFGSSNAVSTQQLYFGHVYILDQSGGAPDDFLGDSKVVALHANGNGTTSDFTGSDGNSTNNFELVDETDTDDDVTYVESSTAGHIDLYTFEDLSTAGTIFAVQVNSVVKKDDAGARTMRTVARPLATDYFGASIAPSDGSYTNERTVYPVSPETSVAWTKAEVDGSEFGVEIET